MSDATLATPHQYIAKGDLAGLKAWQAGGGDLQNRFDNQETLLHKASYCGNASLVQFLLDQGLSVSAVDKSGYRPLHEAARNGQFEAARLLLAAGADPEALISNGKSAQDLAAEKGATSLAEMLKFARLKPFWVRSDKDEVSHVAYKQGIGYRLTEIFNFRAETYTAVARNLEAGAESLALKTFDDLRGSPLLEEARREFQRLGGELPDTTAGFDKPKSRPAPGLRLNPPP